MRRVRIGFVLLGVAAAAVAGVDAASLLAVRPAERPCATRSGPDPFAVAGRFLETAVERRELRASFGLALPSLRGRISCEQWAHGRLPVPHVADIDWTRTAYKVIASGEGQFVLRVFVYQPNATLPAPFLMEVQQEPVGWQVGYFARDGEYAAPDLAA
jgi:hypothetical protein